MNLQREQPAATQENLPSPCDLQSGLSVLESPRLVISLNLSTVYDDRLTFDQNRAANLRVLGSVRSPKFKFGFPG